MLKEIKDNMMSLSYQIENINKAIEIIKKSQIEIMELKSTTH